MHETPSTQPSTTEKQPWSAPQLSQLSLDETMWGEGFLSDADGGFTSVTPT